jgi:hypothetical protein
VNIASYPPFDGFCFAGNRFARRKQTAVQSPAPNAAGWNNTNVTISLSSMDNELGGTGVKQIQWSMGGAQIASSTISGGTTAVSISTEGTKILTYFGTDNAGNQEASKTLTVHIDKTPLSIYGARTPAILCQC